MSTIPADLAQAHEEWHATYRQLAMHPGTELRQQLIRLSSEVLFHSYWQGQRSAAWAALHGARHVRAVS